MASPCEFVPDRIVDDGCDGSIYCAAKRHVHGCFADQGNCDEPNEYHGAPFGVDPYEWRESGE